MRDVEARARLLEILRAKVKDPESDHGNAEDALLQYINDPEITEAWNKASEGWWYA